MSDTITEDLVNDEVISEDREWLPEDLREESSLSKFKDPDSVYKSYVELEKKMGGATKMPNEDSAPEEVDSFYSKLGMPENEKDYEISDDLPDIKLNKTSEDGFRKFARSQRFTKDQFKAAHKFYLDSLSSMQKEIGRKGEEEKDAAIEDLRKDWGNAYDKNVEIARRGVKTNGGRIASLLEKATLDGMQLGNHPDVIRHYYDLGRQDSDDVFVTGDTVPEKKEQSLAEQFYDNPKSEGMFSHLQESSG